MTPRHMREAKCSHHKLQIHMLRSYLENSTLEYVILNYGFHGLRKQIFENVINNIRDLDYQLIPIAITCSYDENRDRMHKDGRDEERISRALATRNIYEVLDNPIIDTTNMSVEETVCKVVTIVKK